MDEKEARKICKSLGLNITGVLGVILKAYKSGRISSFKEVLDDLITEAGFRISNSLYENILAETKKSQSK